MTDMEKQPLLPRNNGAESQIRTESPKRTLSELHDEMFQAQRRYLRAWSQTSSGIWHRIIMIGVSLLLLAVVALSLTVIAQEALTPDPVVRKVPLEAHIMSKCPDARDCLHDLILPAMQEIEDQVDFKLSYIGSETSHDDGVVCKHGPSECVGNIVELCAANLYPLKFSLGFTMCLTRDYKNIPDRSLIEDCALEHGISMQKLNDCTVDEDGVLIVEELKASFRRSQAANVTKSCTVRLDGQVRCIRDGGEWYDCEGGHRVEDLVKDVKKLSTLSYS